ncbi:hypothetical protein [Coraliomargarita parva]|uniref:hypothetical protein n=1 Tax=Coraliomargarita parva TaxID=3014050 RepID=UPI0022B364A3|nr:hypothetical protein [Coraliomargarita parva]
MEKYSEAEWEHLRKRFFSSILNDTEIAKLGQNVGISWPFKGSDETPAKYIDFTFEELRDVPGLVGKQKRIHLLMDILRETLAFDDPFSDMVDTVESESEVDDTFERILAKLQIPTNFPAKFVHFTQDTNDLLESEDLQTLVEVIHFGQRLAQNVVVGGDLKSFLNGLAHKDEVGIAKHIPYRRGERGVHLAEAIGLIAIELSEPIQLELLSQSGVQLTDEEEAIRAKASKLTIDGSIKRAIEKVSDVCQWFTSESSDLEQIFSTGGSPERFFINMNQPKLERIAVALARIKFGALEQRKGFFGKIFGR